MKKEIQEIIDNRVKKVEEVIKKIVGEENFITIETRVSAYDFDYSYGALFLINNIQYWSHGFLKVDKSEDDFNKEVKKLEQKLKRCIKEENK